MMHLRSTRHVKSLGFTIVELLIVIVVIGILATITIVAYNGIQGRAKTASMLSDFEVLNKALASYYVVNQSYPATKINDVIQVPGCTSGWCGWNNTVDNSFIPGVAPEFINHTPQLTTGVEKDTYLYQSDGTQYQLIRFRAEGVPAYEFKGNPMTPLTEDGYDSDGGLAWGYRSNPNTRWW